MVRHVNTKDKKFSKTSVTKSSKQKKSRSVKPGVKSRANTKKKSSKTISFDINKSDTVLNNSVSKLIKALNPKKTKIIGMAALGGVAAAAATYYGYKKYKSKNLKHDTNLEVIPFTPPRQQTLRPSTPPLKKSPYSYHSPSYTVSPPSSPAKEYKEYNEPSSSMSYITPPTTPFRHKEKQNVSPSKIPVLKKPRI